MDDILISVCAKISNMKPHNIGAAIVIASAFAFTTIPGVAHAADPMPLPGPTVTETTTFEFNCASGNIEWSLVTTTDEWVGPDTVTVTPLASDPMTVDELIAHCGIYPAAVATPMPLPSIPVTLVVGPAEYTGPTLAATG